VKLVGVEVAGAIQPRLFPLIRHVDDERGQGSSFHFAPGFLNRPYSSSSVNGTHLN